MTPCIDLAAWKKLQAHAATMKDVRLTDLFAKDPARFDSLSIRLPGLLADFSKNIVTAETLALLTDLLNESGFKACAMTCSRASTST